MRPACDYPKKVEIIKFSLPPITLHHRPISSRRSTTLDFPPYHQKWAFRWSHTSDKRNGYYNKHNLLILFVVLPGTSVRHTNIQLLCSLNNGLALTRWHVVGDSGRELAVVHNEHLQVALVAHQKFIETIGEHVTGLGSEWKRKEREGKKGKEGKNRKKRKKGKIMWVTLNHWHVHVINPSSRYPALPFPHRIELRKDHSGEAKKKKKKK